MSKAPPSSVSLGVANPVSRSPPPQSSASAVSSSVPGHPNTASKSVPPQSQSNREPQQQLQQQQQPQKLTPQQIQQLQQRQARQQRQLEQSHIQKYPVEWQRELVEYIDKCRKASSEAERKQLFSTLHFNTNSRAILEKYSTYPPSMEFHIFTNHYRFGSQEGMIDKDDPMIRDFLIHVAREEIPPSMIEILFDSKIKLYEGCLILKVTDHRSNRNHAPPNGTSAIYKSYNAILKPTPLTFYHDLLYLSDKQNGVHTSMDRIFLELEAKLLSILKPKLDLSVPLNPYKNSKIHKVNRSSFPKIVSKKNEKNEDQNVIVHDHRIEEPNVSRKKLHEHLGKHNTTEIDEFMSSLGSFKNNNNGKFSRLRLVEAFRKNNSNNSSTLVSSYPILVSKKVSNSTLVPNLRSPQSSSNSTASRKSLLNNSLNKKSNPVVSPTINTKTASQSKSGKSTAPSTPTVASSSASTAAKKKNANRKNSVNNNVSGRKNVAGKTLPGQFNSNSASNSGSAVSSPKITKPQTKKRTYNTKKKREAAERLAKEKEAAAAAAAAAQTANSSPTKIESKNKASPMKNDKQQQLASKVQQQKSAQIQKQQESLLAAQKLLSSKNEKSSSQNSDVNAQAKSSNSARSTERVNKDASSNAVNLNSIDMNNFETAFNTMMNNNNNNDNNSNGSANNSNNDNNNSNNSNNSSNGNAAGFDMNFLNNMNFDTMGNIN